MQEFSCDHCGCNFIAVREHQRFCSTNCRVYHHRVLGKTEPKKKPATVPPIPPVEVSETHGSLDTFFRQVERLCEDLNWATAASVIGGRGKPTDEAIADLKAQLASYVNVTHSTIERTSNTATMTWRQRHAESVRKNGDTPNQKCAVPMRVTITFEIDDQLEVGPLSASSNA